MAEIGAYYITIMPSMKGFSSAVNRQLRGLGKAGGKDYSGGFWSVLKGSAIGTVLGNLATRAGSAIVGGLQTGIDRADTLRNFPRVMEAMGYSADEAEAGIGKIMERLRGLPASTQDVVRLTQAIADSTGDMGLAVDASLAFTDAMIAQGASAGEVTQAQGVLNRILGKGNATAAQWQSIQSVMTPQLAATAEALLGEGHSVEELRDKLNDGTVSWNDFLRKLVELDTEGNGHMKSFYEQAKANSDGIGTAIQNMGWRIGTGWANIIDAIGVDNISGSINGAADLISGAMSGIGDAIKDLKQRLAENGALENLQVVMEGVSGAFGSLADTASGALAQAVPVIADLIDTCLQWLVDHGEEIKGFADGVAYGFGSIAEIVGGALKEAAPVAGSLVSDVLEWFLNNGETVATLIGGVAGAMGGFAVAQTAVQTVSTLPTIFANLAAVLPMVTSIGDIPAALALVGEAGGPAGTAIAGLSGALGFLAANPMVLAIAAIAGIVAALATWIITTEDGKKAWDDFCKGVADLIGGLKRDFDGMVARIRQNLEDNAVQWEVFKTNVGNVIQGIAGFFTNLKKDFDNMVATIRQNLEDNALVWEQFKTNVGETIEGIKTRVTEVFEGVRETITKEIQSAKDEAARIIDGIKGLFKFEWSLPAPKLPHITWGWQDVGGLVSIPTFGIDWYAKGGVFDSATLIGIGEKGREAALPLNDATYGEIAEGIAGKMYGTYGQAPTVLMTGNTFVVRDDSDIDLIAEAVARRVARERAGALA